MWLSQVCCGRSGMGIVALVLTLFASGLSWAGNSVLSGEFNGSEPRAENLPGTCSLAGGQPYQEVPFVVSESGTYNIFDAFEFYGINVTVSIYEEDFNPGNPQQNLLTPSGIDAAQSVELFTAVDYIALLSEWCPPEEEELIFIPYQKQRMVNFDDAGIIECPQGEQELIELPYPVHHYYPPTIVRDEGAWAVGISGPGEVESTSRVNVPEFTSGTFTGADPMLESDCGTSQYQQTGPIQVSKDGTYYYTDLSIAHAVDVCLQIYSEPLNTSNPNANRVAHLDDAGTVELEAGQDYYVVVQPWLEPDNGEFFYVFAPPAPFRLNPAMSGSWYNTETPGQGFFMDFFDTLNLVFLSWFTYDLSRPDDAVEAEIGEPGHRWLTAFGPFSEGHAELAVEVTVGGVFDNGQPTPTQSPGGTISMDFDNCLCGELSYDFGGGLSGVVPIQRIAFDAFGICEASYRGPAMAGPLD